MRAPIHLSTAILRLVTAAMLVAWAAPLSAQGTESSSGAIDAQVWTAVSTTVLEHDIIGMGAIYQPDAVLVTAFNCVSCGSLTRVPGATAHRQAAHRVERQLSAAGPFAHFQRNGPCKRGHITTC